MDIKSFIEKPIITFLLSVGILLGVTAVGSASPYSIIQTNKGPMLIKLFNAAAPKTVSNFVKLIDSHFYDGLLFHRYVKGFIVQGGDPTGTGRGGPGYTLPAEINSNKHLLGTLAMARTSDSVNPQRRSSGSQFYICLAPQPFLDGKYTTFGRVVKGFDVLMRLRKGDKMLVLTSYKNKISAERAYKLLKKFLSLSKPYSKPAKNYRNK